MTDLGKKIQATRKAKHITQKKLAELANISRSHIGAIERGQYPPSLAVLTDIANVLKVSVSTLLGEIDVHTLGQEESYVLNGFRKLDISNRRTIINMLDFLNTPNQMSGNLNIQSHNGSGNFFNVNGGNQYVGG